MCIVLIMAGLVALVLLAVDAEPRPDRRASALSGLRERTLPVKLGAKIEAGRFVGIAGGYARPLEGGDDFGGIAIAAADNTAGGADGAVDVRVYVAGDFRMQIAGGQGGVGPGGAVYAVDSRELSVTPAGNTMIGRRVLTPDTSGLSGVTVSTDVVVRIETRPAAGRTRGVVGSPYRVIHKMMESTAGVTITSTEMNSVVRFSGARSGPVYLPAAAGVGAGAWITFYNVDRGGPDRFVPCGTDEINGATELRFSMYRFGVVTLMSDGGGWVVLAHGLNG